MRTKRDRTDARKRLIRTMAKIVELVKLVPNPEAWNFVISQNNNVYSQAKDGTYQRSWLLSNGSVSPIKKR